MNINSQPHPQPAAQRWSARWWSQSRSQRTGLGCLRAENFPASRFGGSTWVVLAPARTIESNIVAVPGAGEGDRLTQRP